MFRRGSLLVSVAAMIIAAILWGPRLWQRTSLLCVQWRCLHYSPSMDQVVCTERPFENGTLASFPLALPDPAILSTYLARNPSFAGTTQAASGPLLFMHERRSPAGKPLLMIVRRVPPQLRQSVDCPLLYQGVLIEPATWTQDAKIVSIWEVAGDALTPGSDVRFFAGQCDPSNRARFDIGFDQGGRRGRINGVMVKDVASWPAVKLEVEQ